MWTIELLVAFALCQEPGLTTPPATPPLTIGSTFVAQLADAHSTARYSVTIRKDDVIELSLESYDFDARLRVERENGALVGEDDDSGTETDARLVVGPGVEGMLVLVVSSKDGSGEYSALASPISGTPSTTTAATSEAVEWRSHALRRSTERGDRHAEIRHRCGLGVALMEVGQIENAIAELENVLANSAPDDDALARIDALGSLGTIHHDKNDLARALQYREASLAAARTTADHTRVAKSLGNLGVTCLAIGDTERARSLFTENVALARSISDHLSTATALGNLGIIAIRTGDLDGADSLFSEVRELGRSISNPLVEARSLANLADVRFSARRFDESIALAEESLAIADRHSLPGFAAATANRIAVVYRERGDMTAARMHSERAVELARDSGDQLVEAMALANLAIVYQMTGEVDRMLECYRRAFDIARSTGDAYGQALSLFGLGLSYQMLGEHESAGDAFASCLPLLRAAGMRPAIAMTLGNLGFVNNALGEHELAIQRHKESIQLFADLGMKANVAQAYGGIADAEFYAGRFSAATAAITTMLDQMRELGDTYQVAIALDAYGRIVRAEGKPEVALGICGEAAATARGLGSMRVLESALSTQAACLVDLGRVADARAVLDEIDRRSDLVSDEARAAEPHGTRLYQAQLLSGLRQDLTALALAQSSSSNGRTAAAAAGFVAAGQSKDRSLLRGIAEHRSGVRNARAIEVRRERERSLADHSATLSQVSAAIQRGESPQVVDELRQSASVLCDRAMELADELRRISPKDAALDLPTGVTFDDIRKFVVGPDDVLVDYVDGEHRVYAYCVSQDSAEFFDLGTKKEIAAEVGAFLSGITVWQRRAPPAAIATSGRALFERLLAPLLSNLGRAPARLVIVPNALLSTVPFEALVMSTRSSDPRSFAEIDFVIDRFDVSYGPSSPILVELASIGPRTTPGKLLLLADPVYESESITTRSAPDPAPEPPTLSILGRRAPPPTLSLQRVEKTRTEAFAIADRLVPSSDKAGLLGLAHLRSMRSGSASSISLDLHLGTAASRDRITTDMREYAVVHLACHGYIDAEVPRRSGLVFSPTPEDGGWFTIADALELDLDANLVVLSACQTARGDGRSSEGVESMARAFLYSGARAVVASLWDVSDVAAAETMARTYAGVLRDGRPAAQALLDAKRFVRSNAVTRGVGVEPDGPVIDDELGHPNLWAPFIHIGLIR